MAKVLPDISVTSALTAVKHGNTDSQLGTHQKIIDMAMNGVRCRATTRIIGVVLNTIFRHLKNSGRSQ